MGFLKDFKLALRLNETISMELQFVGIMHFNLEDKMLEEQKCVVLTDSDGNVTAVSKEAANIFEIDDNIFMYNREFKKIYKVSFFKYYSINFFSL